MLEVRVRKKLGDFSLDADFTLERPEISALLGRSGAGKTTLAKMLAGLTRPDEGRIVFDGRVLFDSSAKCNVPPEGRGVGYVFQEHRLFPHLSVRRNLTFGQFPGRRKPKENLAKVVELLKIGHLLDRSPLTLSGGESQRVAIGRALCACSSFIIMDEPLSSLDAGLKDEIMDYIAMLPRNFSFPIIYITHSMDEVKRLAKTAAVIAEGRLKSFGTVSAALR